MSGVDWSGIPKPQPTMTTLRTKTHDPDDDQPYRSGPRYGKRPPDTRPSVWIMNPDGRAVSVREGSNEHAKAIDPDRNDWRIASEAEIEAARVSEPTRTPDYASILVVNPSGRRVRLATEGPHAAAAELLAAIDDPDNEHWRRVDDDDEED